MMRLSCRCLTTGFLLPVFLFVWPAATIAETRTVEAADAEGAIEIAEGLVSFADYYCSTTSLAGAAQDDEGWEMTDECFEYIIGGLFACVALGALSLGAGCFAATYFVVAGCTCISAWGFYDWATRNLIWAGCVVVIGGSSPYSADPYEACGDLPDWSTALDDTPECQGRT